MFIFRKILLYSCICAFNLVLNAQSIVITGRITDAETGDALPFVNLVMDETLKGGISDINGNFRLESVMPVSNIKVSYVGYISDTIEVNGRSSIDIQMQRSAIQLNEVIILPGENPAHRMIDSAIARRKENNPFELNSFSYDSYSKFFITLGIDSLFTIPEEKLDSEQLALKNFFTTHYLFLMENSSQRRYLKPSLDNETVIASKVSGFSDPLLTLLMSQIQSFSFYKPLITISDKNYVNPISPGSTSKYFFLLEDTIYDGLDSVFVISYRPMRGATFDGLKGLLYIHTAGWALQAVTAEPAIKEQTGMSVRIKQNYQRPDAVHWFPSQLHTEIYFSTLQVNEYPVYGSGVTTLSNIRINPPLEKRDFGTAMVTIDPEAKHRDSLYWKQIRPDTLSDRERNTYHFIDSIGKKEHFDRLLDLTTTLLSGFIPVGPLSIDINALYRNNVVEGSRPGLGLKTGYRVSRRWSLYGYYGYGFKDKRHKYAAEWNLLLKKSRQMNVSIGFKHDVRENGSMESETNSQKLLSTTGLRNYLISRIDYTDALYGNFHSLMGRHWEISARLSRTVFYAPDSILHGSELTGGFSGSNTFILNDASCHIRFSKGTQYVESEDYSLPIGSYHPAPVITFDLRQSFRDASGDGIVRSMALFSITQSLKTRYAGTFSYMLQSGFVTPGTPLSLMFNAPASYRSFTIASPYSFETMRMNEFYSTAFVFVFLRHSFGSLRPPQRKFSPVPEIITSFAWGTKGNTDHLHVPGFQTPEKGFFESGLFINRIINTGFYSLGAGLVYRYGPYGFDAFRDNATVKISLNYAL